MKTRSVLAAVALSLLLMVVGSGLSAQEIVPTPDPVGGQSSDEASPTPATTAAPDGWRYRWFNDRWWYWTEDNRWMWYNDDEQWVDYDVSQGPSPASPDAMPPLPTGGRVHSAPDYVYPLTPRVGLPYTPLPYSSLSGGPPGYYYPYYGPRYPVGYYYPGVGVAVGRPVRVDVRGAHGAVRVGRIRVGW